MACGWWSKDNIPLFICVILLAVANAAKILLLPLQTYSGCVEMTAIGEALSSRGHNSTIFLLSNFNDRKCYGEGKVRPLKFKALSGPAAPKTPEKIYDSVTDLLMNGEEASFSTQIGVIKEMIAYHCAGVVSDTRMWKHFRAEKFDMVVVEGSVFTYCYFLIPYKLRIPYVAYSTVFEDYTMAGPFLPSLAPSPFSHDTDHMSLFQRIRNLYRQLYTHITVRMAIPGSVFVSVAPELSTRNLLYLAAKSDLFLQNSDPIIGYATPRMPNHIQIGGITARPPRPLPGEMKQLYDKEKGGVVIMSLGSTFKALPMTVKHKILRTLYKLNVAVIWKYSQENDNKNVKSVKWFPQNDLLGHPKTRLFISHCGSNSVFEALYHAVPLICFPLYGDQFFNAARVEKWRVGYSLSLLYSSEDAMFSTLSYVLHNVTFKANMKRASDIFKSRPETPRERAAIWIDHVMRFGGSHLRSRAQDMSFITFLGYDVFVILSLVFISCQILLYKGFKFVQMQFILWQSRKQKNT